MLTYSKENKEILNGFISKKENNTLEEYIKNKAWEEDLNGETRVYLVKDKSGDIVLFFSVRCGLLVEEYSAEKLPEDKQNFVDTVVDSILKNDTSTEKYLYEYGCECYAYEECDRLFKIAKNRVHSKNESKVIGQFNTIKVHKCIPAIEVAHLCKNESFQVPQGLDIPIGFGVFWEIIVPLVIDVAEVIGCKYVYLFAADRTDKQKEDIDRKLVSYYKNHFKFSECEETIKFIKPEYDNYCYGLIQEVAELKTNREAIWTEFSDISI